MAKLSVRISPKGKVEMGVAGAVGGSCMQITENLRNNLCGAQELQHTGEYCQVQEERIEVQNENPGA